jgi:hypothetical protein
VNRLAFALVLLLGGLALSQPDTYFAPIFARTPATSPVGATAMGTAIWLPDPGVDAVQSLLFGTGGGSAVPFRLATQTLATVQGFPAAVDAVAAAPGVVVNGRYRTLLALLTGGDVTFGTVESGAFVPRPPNVPINAGTQIALSAVQGGRAALLVANGSQIFRFEIDASGQQILVTSGGSISARPNGTTDDSNTLVFDGMSNLGFVGGRVLGDIYQFDARLDAGPPTGFDIALVSGGRLAAPVTGLALYAVPAATYLLAANGQGITLYDLKAATPALSGVRVIPVDAVGPITAPAGVSLTNLRVDPPFAKGVIAVGDRTQAGLALLDWGQLALQVDGGLSVDTSFDPRGPVTDGGLPDGGVPDSGVPDSGSGGGGNATPGGGGPQGPGIPVDHGSSSCATAAGGPVLLLLLAGLGVLPRRRQRR